MSEQKRVHTDAILHLCGGKDDARIASRTIANEDVRD
jgi:hypothetical protein